MVERILFVINASSATGHSNAVIDRLCRVLRNVLPCRTDLQVETVDTHRQVKAKTNAFLAASDAPKAIISGGGGGTLRAVIEAVCEGCEPGSLSGGGRVHLDRPTGPSGDGLLNDVRRETGVVCRGSGKQNDAGCLSGIQNRGIRLLDRSSRKGLVD